jgi:hypothetical protein
MFLISNVRRPQSIAVVTVNHPLLNIETVVHWHVALRYQSNNILFHKRELEISQCAFSPHPSSGRLKLQRPHALSIALPSGLAKANANAREIGAD